ncbi:MAG: [FeFe] hydrogenase H-cluster maturation GTPase HydF [Candidatus Adiutrix sp.]|jgi:[FeFe] hydrogenase H-cluster maturation GTPase HydF|nr:[FeFe] hydrogenase H-cluster maturation GTPase HydF [Candidatus Adiutrix sp.]
MSLNETPSDNRLHISFFGRRNAGKSSLVNAVTGQDLAVVSEVKGTTTDPVQKAMELLPIGPVLIIDTPGFDDDSGLLGEKRVERTRRILRKTDVAVLVVDALLGLTGPDEELLGLFKARGLNHLVVFNKCDLLPNLPVEAPGTIYVSAATRDRIEEFKEKLAALAIGREPEPKIIGDLIEPSDFLVLVVPIDKAAPKGRLILPQQQTIRDILDAGGAPVVARETELKGVLAGLLRPPRLVITDSQVFDQVAADTPPEVPLTSFSILFARYKGFLDQAVHGVRALDRLAQGDQVLIAEGCTHHRQCEDIGTVKLPRWIRDRSGLNIDFIFTAGGDFPEDLSPYRLVIHCGACMLNEREMKYRQRIASDQGAPFTNYGLAIAHLRGVLKRSLGLWPHLVAELES